MFFVIIAIMCSIVTYDILTDVIGVMLALAGVLIGVVVGYIVGHLTNVKWHEETSKVISRIDKVGGTVLAVYILFSLSRKWIFGHWIHGSALTAFSFSIILGVMTGRLLSIRNKIIHVLKVKGFFNL